MLIGGLQKISLIDYPGKISCIIFTIGCNFRCPFCHNSQLVLEKKIKQLNHIKEGEIFDFLKKRKNLLEAVEITGGEPCLQTDLVSFIKKIKELGYLVKLDTNGSFPEKLEEIVSQNLVDFIAMDIKSPLTKEKYSKACGIKITDEKLKKIKRSVSIIIKSGVAYEFRTTAVPGLHTKEDIEAIVKYIKGAKKFVIQNFVPQNCINPEYEKKKSFSVAELNTFKSIAEKFVKTEIRANY
ncbi:MAG: anaerobic ribonucleoside-triphosphate reductase activating protein [Candidatus Aenigmarchaeota archaeon]|nr:anaerobic ribonucleoside-triphosphate reductase activating protein [Candidatus Aenigmarchaeota archaeon]